MALAARDTKRKPAAPQRPVRKLTALQIGRACDALAAADPVMADVIETCGRCSITLDTGRPFHLLARSIVSQQLSTRAAATISERLHVLCGSDVLEAHAMLAISDVRLRKAGLSRAKVRYIKALATSVSNGELNFSAHPDSPDDAIIADLTRVPGIGQWTAEMYLMFGLGRPDIASGGDLGLRKAAQQIYALPERPDAAQFMLLAERWRPWRTVACWYLWRIVD